MPTAGIDASDVARFNALGESWWAADGPMAPLHAINPVRLAWIRDQIAGHFVLQNPPGTPLKGIRLLDVGCGGGLLSEPMSRMGAQVLGLDPAPASIEIAKSHAEETGAEADYRQGTVEELLHEGVAFDVVLAMEVIEHVPDPAAFVAAATRLVAPGGIFLASTLNRTLKSFALAIVGAEYVLRWLEPGTHHWEQFVTPEEFAAHLEAAGFETRARRGLVYDPLRREWRLSSDLGVNYFLAASRPIAFGR